MRDQYGDIETMLISPLLSQIYRPLAGGTFYLYGTSFRSGATHWYALWWNGSDWVDDGVGWRDVSLGCNISPPDLGSVTLYAFDWGEAIGTQGYGNYGPFAVRDGGYCTLNLQTGELTGDVATPTGEPRAQITGYTPPPTQAAQGEMINISLTLRNVGDGEGWITTWGQIDSQDLAPLGDPWEWLSPGQEHSWTYQFTMPGRDVVGRVDGKHWDDVSQSYVVDDSRSFGVSLETQLPSEFGSIEIIGYERR